MTVDGDRVAALEAELCEMRLRLAALENTGGEPTTRRDLLRRAGLAAAGGIGAALVLPRPAAADNGQSLTIGTTNDGANTTSLSAESSFFDGAVLSVSGTAVADTQAVTAVSAFGNGAGSGLSASGGSAGGPGVTGFGGGTTGEGIRGQGGNASSTAAGVGVGVFGIGGDGAAGILGRGGSAATGVEGEGNGTGSGGVFTGGLLPGSSGVVGKGHALGGDFTGLGPFLLTNADAGHGLQATGGTGSGTGLSGAGVRAFGGNAANSGQSAGVGIRAVGGAGTANNRPGSAGADVIGGTGHGTGAGGEGLVAAGSFGGASGEGGRGIVVIGGGVNQLRGAQIRLVPATISGHPTAGARQAGDVFLDTNQTMWICAAGGSPGTWIRVGGFNPLTAPFRLVDTRLVGGALSAGERRPFTIAPSGSAPNNIPTADLISSVMLNVTAVPAPTGHAGSYLTVLPHDAPVIPANNDAPYSHVNWVAGQLQANAVTVRVPSDTGQIDVFNRFGNVHLIIDVIGFFG